MTHFTKYFLLIILGAYCIIQCQALSDDYGARLKTRDLSQRLAKRSTLIHSGSQDINYRNTTQLKEGSTETLSESILYIGGDFTAYQNTYYINGVVRYDQYSKSWLSLPSSPNSIGWVSDLVSNGSMMYIGGEFDQVSGVAANNIIKYDSIKNEFSPLCGGVDGTVDAVAVLGNYVFVGGFFDNALSCSTETVIVYNVAYFDVVKQKWYTTGLGLPCSQVLTLAVDIFEGIMYVYAAGNKFAECLNPGAPASPFIAAWNTSAQIWEDMGSLGASAELNNGYYVLAVNPLTHAVYIGGSFTSIDNVVLDSIAVWNTGNSSWGPVAGGVGYIGIINAIDFVSRTINDSDTTYDMVIGGYFLWAGTTTNTVNNVAIYDGDQWHPIGGGVSGESLDYCGDVLSAYVEDISVHESMLCFTGLFQTADGDIDVTNIAFYDLEAETWQRVGNDTVFDNTALYSSAFNDQGNLFVIGQPVQVLYPYSAYPVDSLIFSEWDVETNQWVTVNNNLSTGFLDSGKVRAIAINGSNTYVAGQFAVSGNTTVVSNIAVFDGSTWKPLGPGIENGIVFTLVVFGSDLYVGGNFNFTLPNGDQAVGVARYDTSTGEWDNLGGGIYGSCYFQNTVYTIDTYQQYVYFAGSFQSLGTPYPNSSANIAAYDTEQEKWVHITIGIPGTQSDAYIKQLVVNGTYLYAVGRFALLCGNISTINVNSTLENVTHLVSTNIAIWDLQQLRWLPFPEVTLNTPLSGSEGHINAIVINGNQSIIVGGVFDMIDNINVNNIAKGIINITSNNITVLWSSIQTGLSSSSDTAQVNALEFDAALNVLYVGGVFNNIGGQNLAQYNLSNAEWSSLTSSLSQWEGPVYSISLGVMIQNIGSGSSDDNAYQIIALIVGAAVFGLAILIVIFIFLVRFKNNRVQYVEIPQYPPKKLSMKDLTSDSAISRIEISELELGERIGLGASGEVLRGVYKGKEVAVKRMAFKQNQLTEKFMSDFLYEIKIMSSLDHQNILKFLGVSITPGGEVLLLTEYMDNGSVRDLLDKVSTSSIKLDFKLKLKLAIDAATGMDYLHNCEPSIIHRDLKSSNLLIDKKWRCKISDFGISRIKPTNTRTMTLVGTPAYMAPEVITSNKYSEKTDVYSFGILLCELYTGEPPYLDSNLFPEQVMYAVVHSGLRPSLPEDCPSALAVLVRDCLNADPQKRPNFAEIKQRLKRLS